MTNIVKKTPTWETALSTEKENDWLYDQLNEFNKNKISFKGQHLEIAKNYVIKDDNKIIAGIKSCIYFEEVLYIEVLFIDEHYRHKGLGSFLLKKVELESRAMGVKLVCLDTLDFQAKDFYLKKHGYEIYGVLDDCLKGHKLYCLKKSLEN